MIAERLTALRLAAGASQDKVAQDLHMTRSSYSSYETGRRMPPVEALAPLAQYYNTTTDYILGISDERNPIPQLDERGRALIRLYASGTQAAFLGHLSGENNTPEVAYETVCGMLREAGIRPDSDIAVNVARREQVSDMVVLEAPEEQRRKVFF